MEYVSGLLFEYYHICKRKMWYYANGISLEETNSNVQIGKLIDENSYSRERKHILVDDITNIDFLRDETVYEVKKSSALIDASIAQVKYYLYVLHIKGLTNMKGEIRIPTEKKTIPVSLSEDDISEIEIKVKEIDRLIHSTEVPPAIDNKKVCKKCAFYSFCTI